MHFSLSRIDRKMVVFGVMGAMGCLVAAILGEAWLWITRSAPPASPSRAIVLLLDCSGSMAGGKLDEMKDAAEQFIERQDLSRDAIAIIGFGSSVERASPFSHDTSLLRSAVVGLADGGSTNMAAGLSAAQSQLSNVQGSKNILLFTDGAPDDPRSTSQAADHCRNADIQIVAVATGDADTDYLAILTHDRQLVFPASVGSFSAAFTQAEAAIHGKQLVETQAFGGSLGLGLLRIAAWAALLAVGTSLALVAGQSWYLRRSLPSSRDIWFAAAGGVAAGTLAGACGQLVFAAAPEGLGILIAAARFLGWGILGALVGLGLSFIVPNLLRLRGLQGGAAGGLCGGIGFILGALIFGDSSGRLFGAAILGFCIGIMIAFFEAAFRRWWLEVRYGRGEVRIVTLGSEPVTIGGEPQRCTVLIRDAAPVALRYVVRQGRATCEDVPAERTIDVRPGDSRAVGTATVVVCGEGSASVNSPTTESESQRPRHAGTSADAARVVNHGFLLVVHGRVIPLRQGDRLTPRDLPGLQARTMDNVVAEVVPNPKDPAVLGLKNLSRATWIGTMTNAKRNTIEPDRSLRLEAGIEINFGPFTGRIEVGRD